MTQRKSYSPPTLTPLGTERPELWPQEIAEAMAAPPVLEHGPDDESDEFFLIVIPVT